MIEYIIATSALLACAFAVVYERRSSERRMRLLRGLLTASEEERDSERQSSNSRIWWHSSVQLTIPEKDCSNVGNDPVTARNSEKLFFRLPPNILFHPEDYEASLVLFREGFEKLIRALPASDRERGRAEISQSLVNVLAESGKDVPAWLREMAAEHDSAASE